MLIPGAIYRFTRTDRLRYYRAAHTSVGTDFLYPISVNGSRIADTHSSGREYVILYFMTKWGKLAAVGYWLDPRQAFEQAYVTDATEEDLELITHELEELPEIDAYLDNTLHRDQVELDMDVWGELLEPQEDEEE